MTKVLIAGCGYVGTALGLRLAGKQHRVWGLCRSVYALPAVLHPVAANLCEPETLRRLPEGLDYVFYTAAADEHSDAAYHLAYVVGLRNLLEALVLQGQAPRRVFFTSSTSVYAQTGGEWVDETSTAESTHFSGVRLLEAERLLYAGPYPATVLRLGGIYGPGRTRTIDLVREGLATCAQGPPQYLNHIHLDDCAGALLHLTELERPEALYLGVDHAPADRGEVFRWLARFLGAPPPRLAPRAEEAPIPMRGNKRCSNARLAASGYVFRYPTYREGYAAL